MQNTTFKPGDLIVDKTNADSGCWESLRIVQNGDCLPNLVTRTLDGYTFLINRAHCEHIGLTAEHCHSLREGGFQVQLAGDLDKVKGILRTYHPDWWDDETEWTDENFAMFDGMFTPHVLGWEGAQGIAPSPHADKWLPPQCFVPVVRSWSGSTMGPLEEKIKKLEASLHSAHSERKRAERLLGRTRDKNAALKTANDELREDNAILKARLERASQAQQAHPSMAGELVKDRITGEGPWVVLDDGPDDSGHVRVYDGKWATEDGKLLSRRGSFLHYARALEPATTTDVQRTPDSQKSSQVESLQRTANSSGTALVTLAMAAPVLGYLLLLVL